MVLNCHLMATKENDSSVVGKAGQSDDTARPWLVKFQKERAYSSSFYKYQLCFPVIKKTAISMFPPMLALLGQSQHKVEGRHCVL